jgi:hypothetical protein
MYMNGRKMNNYSVIRVGSVLVLAIALVLATFTFPLGTRTGANPISNSPPNEPSSPVKISAGLVETLMGIQSPMMSTSEPRVLLEK